MEKRLKKGHCYSRAFFFKRKTRRLKTVTAIVEYFSLNGKALIKKCHCYSRAFFLKRKTRRLKTVTAIVGHFSLNGAPPFDFFRHCATFFRKFFNVPKASPIWVFVILQQNALL